MPIFVDPVRFELTIYRLSTDCSTAELQVLNAFSEEGNILLLYQTELSHRMERVVGDRTQRPPACDAIKILYQLAEANER